MIDNLSSPLTERDDENPTSKTQRLALTVRNQKPQGRIWNPSNNLQVWNMNSSHVM